MHKIICLELIKTSLEIVQKHNGSDKWLIEQCSSAYSGEKDVFHAMRDGVEAFHDMRGWAKILTEYYEVISKSGATQGYLEDVLRVSYNLTSAANKVEYSMKLMKEMI